MMREVAQRGPARGIEPVFDPCEVPTPGCVWEIVRHGPDPHQHWKQVGLRVCERVDKGSVVSVVSAARR
jgi:hypothetical protein